MLCGKSQHNDKQTLILKGSGRIALRNIIYCESQNQYQTLYLAPREVKRVRMTLAERYDALGEFPDFVRIGSTYIVNLGYVDSLTAKEMTLSTGEVIWLPRGSYNLLKRQYFDFYHRGG
ncbi:MAG: LytTR family transcriptional regulator DNA-binding domain-containing protein [Clostridia bacterium]